MSSVALPRPAERVAIVSLLLVFLCGAVAGALVMSWGEHAGILHAHAAHQSNSFTSDAERWRRELDLSDQQMHEMNSILDDFGHYYDNLIADGQTRIRQILNPEQRAKFDKMIADGGGR